MILVKVYATMDPKYIIIPKKIGYEKRVHATPIYLFKYANYTLILQKLFKRKFILWGNCPTTLYLDSSLSWCARR